MVEVHLIAAESRSLYFLQLRVCLAVLNDSQTRIIFKKVSAAPKNRRDKIREELEDDSRPTKPAKPNRSNSKGKHVKLKF